MMTGAVGWREVCRRTGVSYRRFDYLMGERLVRCRLRRRGPGTPRLFDPVDVDVAVVIVRLLDRGACHDLLAGVSGALYDLPRPWAPGWLVWRTDGTSRFCARPEEVLEDPLASVLVIAIPPP